MTPEEAGRLRAYYRSIRTEMPVGLPLRVDRGIHQAKERRWKDRAPWAWRGLGVLTVGVCVLLVALPLLSLRYASSGPPGAHGSMQPSPTGEWSGSAADRAGVSSGVMWATRGGTLFVSDDGGSSWTKHSVPSYLASPRMALYFLDHIRLVAVAPQATATGARFSYSLDGGASWRDATTNAQVCQGISYRFAFAFADVDLGYATCAPDSEAGGTSTVLRTVDGGETWSLIGTPGTTPALGAAIAVSDSRTLWAGAQPAQWLTRRLLVGVSRDAGSTWADVPLPGLSSAYGGEFLLVAGGPQFFDTQSGAIAVVDSTQPAVQMRLFRTDDGGSTWVSAGVLQVNGNVTPVAFAAKNRWLVPLLGEDLAFAVSGDEGVTWSTVTPSGAPNGDVTSVCFVDAQHGEILLSVADGVQALYLSSDGGQSWHPANIP